MLPEPNYQAHHPVLLQEVLHYLQPADQECYIDGTFGAGGYTTSLLQAASCRVVAIDKDPAVRPWVKEVEKQFGDRFQFIQGDFSELDHLIKEYAIGKVDGVVLDIGVSSMQIDEGERGFSFQQDGPLDMRMSGEGMDASYVVNHKSEQELADIIFHYGGEKYSRRIARAIVEERKTQPFLRTLQLANVVRSVVKRSKHHDIDPATRTFQAIRIVVNQELDHLRQGLLVAENMLKAGGRLVVVTFHSLEDKIVKEFFRLRSGNVAGHSRHLPDSMVAQEKREESTLKIVTRKVIKPSEEEIASNIRARSAKLRAAIKL